MLPNEDEDFQFRSKVFVVRGIPIIYNELSLMLWNRNLKSSLSRNINKYNSEQIEIISEIVFISSETVV